MWFALRPVWISFFGLFAISGGMIVYELYSTEELIVEGKIVSADLIPAREWQEKYWYSWRDRRSVDEYRTVVSCKIGPTTMVLFSEREEIYRDARDRIGQTVDVRVARVDKYLGDRGMDYKYALTGIE